MMMGANKMSVTLWMGRMRSHKVMFIVFSNSNDFGKNGHDFHNANYGCNKKLGF
jgi:hypothetical protein